MQPDIRVGILGGGQLARMLIEAAEKLAVNIRVYVQSSKDPAAQVSDQFVKGSLTDESELRRFFETIDLVTFENEFVDCDLLERAAAGLEVRFAPSLSAIRCLQDKLNQKSLLARLEVLTSEYFEVGYSLASCRVALEKFGGEAVLKWAKLGYDGKGTYFLSDSFDVKAVEKFLEEAKQKGVRVFAEQKINFKRELAIQSAHSTLGDIVNYPLVISEQDRGICRWVRGPAVKLGVAKEFEISAKEIMKKVAKEICIYGTFAIEFFESVEGRLYVNELAPRVHNTGHYSLIGAKTSQFENHLRAILGEPLGAAEPAPYFAMLNLVGPHDLDESMIAKAPKASESLSIYWYGKHEVRKGRKMGHLAGEAQTKAEFDNLLEEMREVEQNWVKSVKS